MAKVLMKGNEAIGEAAIQAGCRFFFGYPITPQNEIPEYMAKRLPKEGGCFIQAESEVAAINMVYGAAGAGARAMTSSSSPGVSLKQEGISYIAGAQLPCLIVNMSRGGPGLGSIQTAQGDYYQSTRGGGHGDYRTVVLAPANLQETIELVAEGFDIADQYRVPVLILADGMLGQMMEPVEFGTYKPRQLPQKDWATTGMGDRQQPNIVNSLFLEPKDLEQKNLELFEIYDKITANEIKCECIGVDDAELVLTAYGTTARICKTVISMAAKEGIKLGLIRPITLWPFPMSCFAYAAGRANVKGILSVEMSGGQMIDDVKLAVDGKKPVYLHGRTGGMVPYPQEILAQVKSILGGGNA